jgi:hypothetical protein
VSKITHIKALGLALFAVFAFSAVAAASAFAESEWLWKGSPIPAGQELLTDTEGTLTLDVLNAAGTLINEIDCSALFEGAVLPGGIDLVTDVWSLPPSQFLIEELEPSLGVEGKSLSCENLFDAGGDACRISTEAGAETLLWVDELSLALGLTWETLVELMVTGPTFLDHFHNVAFELLCITLETGSDLLALCFGLTSSKLENSGEGVLVEFNEAVGSEALECLNEVGGVDVGTTTVDLVGDIVVLAENGGALAVS